MTLKRQRGMTMIGWLFVICIIGVFTMAAVRLFPIYLEQFKVRAVMKALETEMVGGVANKRDVYDFLAKRFNIEAITRIDARDVLIERGKGVWKVRTRYDARSPFIGSLHFIVTTDESVEIER